MFFFYKLPFFFFNVNVWKSGCSDISVRVNRRLTSPRSTKAWTKQTVSCLPCLLALNSDLSLPPTPAPSHPLLQSASSELCPCLGRENFGEVITCRTGEYRADKVPSDPLPVTIHYGKSTTKTIADDAFQFMENPTVSDHQPKGSFVWSVQQKRVPLQCNISWF